MDVYKIRPKMGHCQNINFDLDSDPPELPLFKGVPIKKWTAPATFIDDPRLPAASFYNFGGNLVCDEKACNVMKSIFEKAGEIHTMDVEGAGELFILNPLEKVDSVDQENIEPYIDPKGVKFGIKKFAFHTCAFSDSSLFWDVAWSTSPTFSYTGKLDPNEEFIGRYQAHNLTGLKFEHLWSSN